VADLVESGYNILELLAMMIIMRACKSPGLKYNKFSLSLN
jgi:hypothetical protein